MSLLASLYLILEIGCMLTRTSKVFSTPVALSTVIVAFPVANVSKTSPLVAIIVGSVEEIAYICKSTAFAGT